MQVDTDNNLQMKNGKKICWNYRKGRCRFASNCTFAHDSDLHELNRKQNNYSIEINKSTVIIRSFFFKVNTNIFLFGFSRLIMWIQSMPETTQITIINQQI